MPTDMHWEVAGLLVLSDVLTTTWQNLCKPEPEVLEVQRLPVNFSCPDNLSKIAGRHKEGEYRAGNEQGHCAHIFDAARPSA